MDSEGLSAELETLDDEVASETGMREQRSKELLERLKGLKHDGAADAGEVMLLQTELLGEVVESLMSLRSVIYLMVMCHRVLKEQLSEAASDVLGAIEEIEIPEVKALTDRTDILVSMMGDLLRGLHID